MLLIGKKVMIGNWHNVKLRRVGAQYNHEYKRSEHHGNKT